jgi:hypothetical protein
MPKAVEFRIADGNPARLKPADVTAVGAVFLKLEETHGSIRNEDLIEAAKPDDSVLHNYFTWDSTKALHSLQQIEAGKLRRSIAIVRPDARGKPVVVPAFIPLTVAQKEPGAAPQDEDDKATRSVSIGVVLSDDEQRARELREAFGYAYAYRNRLALFAELQPLVRLMDKTAADLEKQQATAAASHKLPMADGAAVSAVAG